MQPLLYLVVDPMCSWCWGFRSAWQSFVREIPSSVTIKFLMGGLAPDSDEPMDTNTKTYIQSAWRSVADRSGATFNHQFWAVCQPRRSTYPACRAVITAGLQLNGSRERYYEALQRAYFLDARNPSDYETLIALAKETGLDPVQFQEDLDSSVVQQTFREELIQVRSLGVSGFPTVIWHQQDATDGTCLEVLSTGYTDADTLRERWQVLTEKLMR